MMQAAHLAAIASAFSEQRGALERYLTAITRDPESAQDLTQDAFLRLAREVEAGRTPDDIAAWLRRVGANLAMSRGRHLQVVERRAGQLARPAEPRTPEHEVVESEVHAAALRLVAALPGPEREALLLAAQGYGGSEIAARIERTPGATRTMLCRARAKLREGLLQAGFAPA